MSQEQCPPIDFTGAGSWERSTGGQQGQLLSHNGDFEVTIADAVAGKSKSSDNYQVTFTLVVEDDDNKGKKLVAYIPYTGMAKTDPPRPNSYRLFEVLDSSGTDKAKMAGLEARGQMPIEQICAALKGKKIYVTCSAELYEKKGTWSSKVDWVIERPRYLANKAINAHRTALPPEALAALGGAAPVAGTAASGAASSNGTAARAVPPTASQAATDLL